MFKLNESVRIASGRFGCPFVKMQSAAEPDDKTLPLYSNLDRIVPTPANDWRVAAILKRQSELFSLSRAGRVASILRRSMISKGNLKAGKNDSREIVGKAGFENELSSKSLRV